MAEFTNEDFLSALREAQGTQRRRGPGSFGEWQQEAFGKAPGGAPISPGFGLMGHGSPGLGSKQRQQFGVPSGTAYNQGDSKYDGIRQNQPPPWIDDVDMGNSWYSPMEPVWPFGPPSVTSPREWNYPVGYNLNYVPQRMELAGMLRGMRGSWGVLSTIIETRKDQLLRLPWTIQLRGKPRTSSKAVDLVRKFFKRPDGKLSYSQWSRKYLDDLFVIDAPTLYMDRTVGGRLINAQCLDGGTIFPLIDDAGRRPDTIAEMSEDGVIYQRRQPAFQQIIYGLPMINLSEDELIYGMMRPRPELPMFGYSQVEQILTEATEAIRKTFYQLEFWRAGSMPELIVTVPDNWCYSEDTEVLTKAGWKKFQEVDITSDEFATRNMKTKAFEWQVANGINLSEYDGEMVALQSRTIDCLVNPPHRVLVGDPRFGTEKIVLAGDLLKYNPGSQRIPVTSRWLDGKDITLKSFEHETNRGGGVPLHISGDDFCSFMGAWLADGYTSGRGAAITQTEIGRGYEEIADLIRSITAAEPTRTKDSFIIYNAALVKYLEQFSTAVDKFIPDDIMNASARQIGLFLHFFSMCDGIASGRTLYTSSKRMADQLQELAQKVGLSASIGEDDRRGKVIWVTDHIAMTNAINYRVNISNSSYRKFSATSIPYKGKIGCVSVPNGILYVRRNGKAYWSGNTPRQIAAFQGHFDAVLSGQLTLKSKVRFVPGGMKPFDIKNASGESLWSQRDELLVRLACYAFSVSPTPFVRQTNRATANQAQESADEEGLYPLMSYWKDDVMDTIIQEKMGLDEVEFVYLPRPIADQAKQATIHQVQLHDGLRTLNEVRGELGLEPFPDGDVHLVYTGNSVLRLDQIISGEAIMPGAPAPTEGSVHPAAPTARSQAPMRGSAVPRESGSTSPTPVHKALSAKEIAAAAADAQRHPSKIKAKVGNYRKGHLSYRGLPISIENAKGSKRREKDKTGESIAIKMPAAYGYIRGTIGADNMQVDCYLGKHPESDIVWIVDQDKFDVNGDDKGFDEHKVMLAYSKLKKAMKDYLASHFDGLGHDRMSAVTQMTYAELKAWLKSGDMKKPVSEQGVGVVVGRRGKGNGLMKFDTVSVSTNLNSYSQLPAKRKKKAKGRSGARWLYLAA